jgi:hypothetical protein
MKFDPESAVRQHAGAVVACPKSTDADVEAAASVILDPLAAMSLAALQAEEASIEAHLPPCNVCKRRSDLEVILAGGLTGVDLSMLCQRLERLTRDLRVAVESVTAAEAQAVADRKELAAQVIADPSASPAAKELAKASLGASR